MYASIDQNKIVYFENNNFMNGLLITLKFSKFDQNRLGLQYLEPIVEESVPERTKFSTKTHPQLYTYYRVCKQGLFYK